MDERELVDELYQAWSRTTGVKDKWWQYTDTGETGFDIHANDKYGTGDFIGYFDNKADAEFLIVAQGIVPELVRIYLAALDEADRADRDHDARECRILELEVEVNELKDDLEGLVGR
jgi:hypothetical protein